MFDIKKLRKIKEPNAIVFGNHPGIIQSILDFDFLTGKSHPSVIAIVGVNQKFIRYFYGDREVSIPSYVSLDKVSQATIDSVHVFAVAQSGRRATTTSEEALKFFPNVVGGMIFAESVPEKHAIELRKLAKTSKKFMLGPASVGMTIGGCMKLGAIGGTLPDQIAQSGILGQGSTAVISTSGGMINEIISLVSHAGGSISFAAAIGGERYPLATPVELVKEALEDSATQAIVFFGEVGGTDEYEIAELIKATKTPKKIIAYIAGVSAERFETPPQFGHAKALAQNQSETASAKKEALKNSGVLTADSFAEFEALFQELPKRVDDNVSSVVGRLSIIKGRKKALFYNSVSSDKGGEVKVLGEPLIEYVANRGLSEITLGMFLGHYPKSKKTIEFFDLCLRLLIDHGPQVSGAVNTMITARAGKDLSASLATGILTIGSRFGGAINGAAEHWHEAVSNNESPSAFVERFSNEKRYIPGIGHKKYSLGTPDPRVALLLSSFDNNGKYLTFAKAVAEITTTKKSQLILNVDGAIAALILDIFSTEEGYDDDRLKALLDTEFCNAIFVFARSAGFIAHYLDQKRLDEGLFRLPDDNISVV